MSHIDDLAKLDTNIEYGDIPNNIYGSEIDNESNDNHYELENDTKETISDDIFLDVADIYANQLETDDFSQQNITISLEEIAMYPIIHQKEPPNIIPKIIFIVPYRNRPNQLSAFKTHMKYILEDYPKYDYVIYYIHQKDDRIFNRGAMKNIGFLVVKNKYPNDYKNITLVFNDVDTMPVKKNLFDYDTSQGVVKHFFGFTFTLGGIFSIKAGDFERVNGFPNFWAWGYEDNMMQKRVEQNGIKINRSIFFKIGDMNIIQKNDEITREVNQGEFDRYIRNTQEGIYSIQNLKYDINNDSGFVDVHWFDTEYKPTISKYRLHDLRNGSAPYDTTFGLMYNNRRAQKGKMSMKMYKR